MTVVQLKRDKGLSEFLLLKFFFFFSVSDVAMLSSLILSGTVP